MKKKGKPTDSHAPHIPLSFEDAVSAALQTKPEKKKTKKKPTKR